MSYNFWIYQLGYKSKPMFFLYQFKYVPYINKAGTYDQALATKLLC